MQRDYKYIFECIETGLSCTRNWKKHVGRLIDRPFIASDHAGCCHHYMFRDLYSMKLRTTTLAITICQTSSHRRGVVLADGQTISGSIYTPTARTTLCVLHISPDQWFTHRTWHVCRRHRLICY